MDRPRSFISYLAEAIEHYRSDHHSLAPEPAQPGRQNRLHWLGWQMIPNIGTLLLVAVLLLTIPSLAAPRNTPQATSTSTISYQGRLADSAGNPLTGYYNLEFRIYDVPTGGTPLWEEFWTGGNSVQVSDGLFNVMLGSINNTLAAAIEGHDELYLGITVGTDSEMVPRVQLGSVPFAMYASFANVPDGSITTAKIADGAVTTSKINVDSNLDAHSHELFNVSQLWTLGRIEMGQDGQGEGGEFRLAQGAEGNYWVVDNYYGTLRAWHDGVAYFTLDPNGNLWAAGTKSAVVQAGEFGQRKLYAIESPEVRFFDEGLDQLEDGMARVELDSVFLETIEGQFLVHVTPYGDASLYVAEVGQNYFVVRAREGAPNIAFAWRLSACRKGYGGVRLEEIKQGKVETP